ncbi:hypothetical protein HDV06_002000 [Boothiomyces sp. JEL0866]|nr:hypothetical protein HDV06_002000 [Boothiomyces sp. JEL0866]
MISNSMPPIPDSGIDLSWAQKTSYTATATNILSTASPLQTKDSKAVDASEFISYAMYKLWNPKPVSRRNTFAGFPHNTNPNLPAPYNDIVCPPGTSHWYPKFVHDVHNLLHLSALPTPIIFIGLMYVARLRQMISMEVGEGSEFRLFSAAMMIAQKQNSDSRYANKAWAKMTGFTLPEINLIEKDFLQGMKWKLHVRDDQYDKWVNTLQVLGKEHALVLRAAKMQETELLSLENQLQSRPDLVEEIKQIRRANTTRS